MPRPEVADSGSIAGVVGAPARWSDLSAAALVLGFATSWLPLPLLVVDLNARASFTNAAWTARTGLGPDESLGAGWQAAVDQPGASSIANHLLGHDRRPCAIALVDASGASRRTLLMVEPITGFDGSLLGRILWVPELGQPADGPAYERADPLREANEPWTGDFLARLQGSLDQHEQASTTIAALVIEVDDATDDAEAVVEPAWEAGIDAALVEQIEPLLDQSQSLGRLEHRRIGVLCEEVASYKDVIDLASRLVGLDHPSVVGHAPRAVQVSVGVAFPHLPGERAEGLLQHARQAARLARAQGTSGFEVVIGTGPGSSDVRPPPVDPVQEDLSAPSADLQPRPPSWGDRTVLEGWGG